MSVQVAGIPKPFPIPSSPYVPELIPPSEALPLMEIAFWCVWAAYTTTEHLEVTVATIMSSEVAADAAEHPEIAMLVAVLPEVIVPAAASPKEAADAAEPPEAAVLSLVPRMVVAPSRAVTTIDIEGDKSPPRFRNGQMSPPIFQMLALICCPPLRSALVRMTKKL